jgi:hypothetical protein
MTDEAGGMTIAPGGGNIPVTLRLARKPAMDIRFVSSLNSEDEARLAAAIFAATTRLLEQFEIAYTLRIDTLDGQSLRHSSEGAGQPAAVDHVMAR